MRNPLRFTGALSVVLGVLLFSQQTLKAHDALRELASDDVTVQTRGPVHEAYAQPAEVSPGPGPILPKKPPDPITEMPPDQKPAGDNVIWIPGYWSWDQDRNDYTWVSGSWRNPPPNRKWVPGHWEQANDGWQWVAGFWAPNTQQEVQYVDQPPVSLDEGPSVPAPDNNSTYVSGCWVYRAGDGFVWRPGYWLEARADYLWTPAHYSYTPAGYVYVSGFWDYPLEDRGLLFAPVCFNERIWNAADWYYRPSYCVPWTNLLSCLFVRPDWRHYYFGDYYGADYSRLGFRPWFDYGRRFQDPLLGHYRWAHRDDPGWYRGLDNTYRGRLAGDLARPPRTLTDQNRLLAGGRGDVRTLGVVRPLDQFRDEHIRLTKLTNGQVSRFQQQAQGFHEVSRNRQAVERPGQSQAAGHRSLPLDGVPHSAGVTAPARPGRTAAPSHEISATQPQRPETVHPSQPGPLVRQARPEVVRPTQPSRTSVPPAAARPQVLAPSSPSPHAPVFHPPASNAGRVTPAHGPAAPIAHYTPPRSAPAQSVHPATRSYSPPPSHPAARSYSPPRPTPSHTAPPSHGGSPSGGGGSGGKGGGNHKR